MKKTMIRIGVFTVTFLAALIAASILLNKGNTDMTAEMKLPELPLIFVDVENRQVNLMQGYLMEMDEKYMRNSITPIGDDRKLSICVKKYGCQVTGLSFEVRSVDGSRLVEDTPVEGYQEDGDTIRAELVLKDLIDKHTEYSLTFLLSLEDGREVSYYTRIIQAEDYALEEKLESVANFSADTFDAQACQNLDVYMESSGDNSSLARVTIHSSLEQLAWGSLKNSIEQVTEPVYMIQDITEQTAAITVEYLVGYTRDSMEYMAVVKEVFRMRTGTERMLLLDYERTMSEIFTENASSFADDKVMLGIQDADVEMMESDGGKILAFAQAGVLYSLNTMDHKLSRLFSCYDQENLDERSFYSGHDFKILQVDETGNVVFVVYGYISRGRWEGYTGADVYYYNNSTNTVEEMAFLPSTKSPEILEAELEQLAYINGRNELYVFLNDQICCVYLDRQTVEVIAENLSLDSFQASENNRMIAWQNEGEKYGSSSLTLMNLNTGEKTLIEAPSGSYILPLGFMEEDLVYGMARGTDVTADSTGMTVFPMYEIRIQDENGNVLMNYEKDGIYIVDCSFSGNQILLDRVERREDGGYVTCGEDQIVSGAVAAQKSNTVITVPTTEYGLIAEIQLKTAVDNKKMKFLTPREVLYEGSRQVEIPLSEESVECYYVYDLDGNVTIVSTPREAIDMAYSTAGTVTSRNGTYVWRRERLNTKNQIMAIEGTSVTEEKNSLAVCLDTILSYEGVMRNSEYLLDQGKSVTQVLEENLENIHVLDLEGCSLESVLYYPDREIPVLAILSDENAVLVIGFNEQNVVLMNPETGTVYKMGMNDATEWFAENGNVFLSYVKQ